MLQAIASGLLGASAYQGGVATAALGLALHFFIAIVAAACYFGASLKWPVLIRRPFLCGAAFGLAVFFFMQYVVLPLSDYRVRPLPRSLFINGIVAHVFFVGLPIAFFARRSARAR